MCPKRKAKLNAEQSNTHKKRKGSAHCAKKEKNDNVVDNEALHTSDVENKSGWIVDSEATQHMTFERDHRTDFVEFKKPCEVNLGDNRTILAHGKGNYNIIVDLDGCIKILYFPDLGKNLLLVRAMVKLRALVTFEGDICTISFPEPAIPWEGNGGSGTIRDRHTKNCMSSVLRMRWK